MATEQPPTMPVNGNYAPHQQAYGASEQNHAGYSNNNTTVSSGYGAAPQSTASNTTGSGVTDIPKDEVGWYFVEQYYTTLSRSPEKLYLFYNKRSQYVAGDEAEKAPVCIGQKGINDRIKEHDFHDAKVRVTNVDSQASDQHIVIQVIGEISNRNQPHHKFTQTFVLATQTNGYFVLNDIFRYLIDEEEVPESEEPQQAAAAEPSADEEPALSKTIDEAEPKTLTSSSEPAEIEHDAAKVDKELVEKVLKEEPTAEEVAPPAAAVNGTPSPEDAPLDHAEEASVGATAVSEQEPESAPEVVAEEPIAEEVSQPEKPKDPVPTPAASPPKPTPAQPATAPAAPTAPSAPAASPTPSKPAAPKSWASLAAAAHRVVTPATPAVPAVSSSNSSQSKAPPAPQSQAPGSQATPSASAAHAPASAPSAPVPARDESPASSQQDEWQSVGDHHKRQQSRAQPTAAASEKDNSRAYIKNVYESVDVDELRAALEKFGEIVYFDVSRQKNCAFVDFKTSAGYQAAIAHNPHTIGTDRIYVEERRLKPNSYPYVQRGGMRGGRGGPGGQGQGRGSFPRGGGYNGPRGGGRGGSGAPRGRGGPQAA